MKNTSIKRTPNQDQLLSHAEELFEAGKFRKALGKYRYYLKHHPKDADVLYNCGVLCVAIDDSFAGWNAAFDYFDAALNSPNASIETKSDAMNYIGILMEKAGRTDQARRAYEFALSINPSSPAARVNLGDCLRATCEYDGAEEQFAAALALDPDQPDAKMSRGMIQLLTGNFKEGWKNYEARWGVNNFPTKPFRSLKPMWNGEDLDGKRILLTHEQGFGDAFQFIRYASVLSDAGADVWIFTLPDLAGILKHAKGVSQVVIAIEEGEDEPWDFHCPLLSLPLRVGTFDEDKIPMRDRPYIDTGSIVVDPLFLAAEELPRIGIVWAGSPRHGKDKARSTNPENWQTLIDLFKGEAKFFSFQCGPRMHEVRRLSGVSPFPAQSIRTWAETAVALEQLDLLISVDTGTAHLAGAIGVPTFLVCPYSPDWRWMLGRDDSPWYPYHSIFRQQSPGTWEEMFKQTLPSAVYEWIHSFKAA